MRIAASISRIFGVFATVIGILIPPAILTLIGSNDAIAQDPRARVNPCVAMLEQGTGVGRRNRTLQSQNAMLFYNGVDMLAAPPDKLITLPPEFVGDWRAKCVVLQMVFGGPGEQLSMQSAKLGYIFPTPSNEGAVQFERAAIDVAKQVPFGKVLPRKPQPNVPYLIAIPLWADHGLYKSGVTTVADVAKTLSDDLKPMGYTTVPKIYDQNGVTVYRVADLIRKGQAPQFLFVVVRDIGEDVPIVQYEEFTNPYGLKVWRYTGVVEDIFRNAIAPALRDVEGRIASAEVRHYARNKPFKVDDKKTAPIFERTGDWNTRQLVDHPVFVARYVGRRAKHDAPFEWGSEETTKIAFSTLAEARKLDAQYNVPEAERLAKQVEEKEKAKKYAEEQEIAVAKEQKEIRSQSDPNNALASLGYPSAVALLKEGRTAYYLSNTTPQRSVIVAVSEVGEKDPVIDLVTLDDGTFRYSDARVAFAREKLIPTALARVPDTRLLKIHHHVRGMPLDDMPSFRKFVRSQGLKYEQPIFIEEYGVNEGENQWRPIYEVGTWNRNKSLDGSYMRLGEYSLSIAEARRMRGKKLEDARVAALEPGELSAEIRAKRLKTQAERPKEYVYKSDRFWAYLPQFYIPKKTFEGEFSAFEISRVFPSQYIEFLAAYSNKCAEYIKQRGPYFEYTFTTYTINYDSNGFETSRSAGKSRKMYVEERFNDKYKEYSRSTELMDMGELLSMFLASSRPGEQDKFLTWTFDKIKSALAETIAWNRFMREHNCDGPTIHQIRENVWRAATGQPSLQAAKIPVPNATADTEPWVPLEGTETIFDACYYDHQYKESQLCLCMDQSAEKVMRPEEIKKYSRDFSLFYQENIFPDKRGPSDPTWRLYNLHTECTKRRIDQGTL